MTTPLAPAPNMEQIKKQAKELLRALRSQSLDAAQRFRGSHPEFKEIPSERLISLPMQLSDSQFVVAREYGFSSWPKLKEEVDRRAALLGKTPSIKKPVIHRENGRVYIDGVRNLKWGHHSENTFCGALESALAVTEHPYSTADLMGFSGLAFRTRWFQGNETIDCCPSSPVGEFPDEIDAISRATGWPISQGYPLGDKAKSMEYYWSEVVASIEDGRPVLAYVMMKDVGIIHGYREEDKSIIGWSYDHGQTEDPVELPVDKLGEWIAFLDNHENAPPTADAFIASLRIAVDNYWRDSYDTTRKQGDYRHGERALMSWGSDLTQSQENQGDYYSKLFFVSWWNLSSMHDARGSAVEYLNSHADLLPEAGREAVLKAAELYAEEQKLASRTYTNGDVFLAPWTGKGITDWTPEVKMRERDLLAECAKLESLAIAELEEAIAATV